MISNYSIRLLVVKMGNNISIKLWNIIRIRLTNCLAIVIVTTFGIDQHVPSPRLTFIRSVFTSNIANIILEDFSRFSCRRSQKLQVVFYQWHIAQIISPFMTKSYRLPQNSKNRRKWNIRNLQAIIHIVALSIIRYQ